VGYSIAAGLGDVRWPTSANVQKTHNTTTENCCCGFSGRWHLWATVGTAAKCAAMVYAGTDRHTDGHPTVA